MTLSELIKRSKLKNKAVKKMKYKKSGGGGVSKSMYFWTLNLMKPTPGPYG